MLKKKKQSGKYLIRWANKVKKKKIITGAASFIFTPKITPTN
jgi:hypothetical protein